MLERYVKIAGINLKFHLLPHFLVTILLCMLSPLIMGIGNLDAALTAKIIDMYVSLLGIVMLVPLFLPDQDRDIRDLIASKKVSITILHILRIIQSLILLAIILGTYLVFLKLNNCEFDFLPYFYSAITNCIFMGGLGILIYSLVDNIAVGYMIPMLYYILCIGAGRKYLGKLYLFSLYAGRIEDKKYLLTVGIVMIAMGIALRSATWAKLKCRLS